MAKTAIVTGASQGIGAGIVKEFRARGYNVVASARKMTQSAEISAGGQVALVDGDIGEPETAAKIIEAALSRFHSIDALVNNAGIFFLKPFTDYTVEDFKSLVSTNPGGFLHVTQPSIKQMLAQKTVGSIVPIPAHLVSHVRDEKEQKDYLMVEGLPKLVDNFLSRGIWPGYAGWRRDNGEVVTPADLARFHDTVRAMARASAP